MSAGTGVVHSEYNHTDAPVELFQIWIEPKSYGIAPRYDQKAFDFESKNNQLVLVVSPDGRAGSLSIYQDARIYRGTYSEAREEKCQIAPGNGVYLIIRDGQVKVGDIVLTQGDALSVSEESELVLDIAPASDFVLLEIPPFHNAL
jgi:redox-sensitive bicupin YhaK (pirin superfamily)